MKLFSVSNRGKLTTLEKLDYSKDDIYIVTDFEKNVIYLWSGKNVGQEKILDAAEIARKLDKEHGGSCKILNLEQGKEYGSFSVIMPNLKEGIIPGAYVERRPELILENPNSSDQDPTQRVLKWWKQFNKQLGKITAQEEYKKAEEPSEEEPDLESQIREAAYYLSLENYSYNDLCWFLGEKIQNINMKMPSLEDIRRKAEEIYKSSSTYDELCWLNAELDILIKKEYLEPAKQVNWGNYSL
ncbi:MAG: hypothetical protein EU548_02375 [Promethearchaeota archaeon]|nr:MAG: hypothetical protein EU548_02375 [Candidatus Lokiarchaeota archaeon]